MNVIVSFVLWVVYLLSLYFAIFWFLVLMDGGDKAHGRKALRRFPKVTIVIPAWNECVRDCTGEIRGMVDKTIEHALGLDYPKDKIQLIIVNDASTDGTRKVIQDTIARHESRDILFIDKTQNGGKWRAMNDALEVATGEFMVSLDGDSLLEPSILKSMLPYFTDKKISCVCPNMEVQDPKNLLERMQWYEYVVNMFYKKLMSAIDCVHVAPGPFSVYRTHILRKLGGFRHGYKTEDLEITFRMQKAGYKVLQVLDVKVRTKAPDSWKAFYRQRNRWFKGATLNVWRDYRDMILNRKYGDFGMIQAPIILISGLLSLIISTTFFYYNGKYFFTLFRHLYQVDFDVWSILRAMKMNFYILDISYMDLISFICMMSFSLIILYYSFRACQERVTRHGVVPIVGFFFFYYLVLAVVWIGVAYDLARQKELEW